MVGIGERLAYARRLLGAVMGEEARVCPHCGHPLSGSISRLGGLIFVGFLVLALIGKSCGW